jgi:GTP diphosphokinase / guanosine-3',5'-bis(diphosphate) 3'-diphosphatase
MLSVAYISDLSTDPLNRNCMSSILVNSTTELALPEWLHKCLRESSAYKGEAEADRRYSDAVLIGKAFEFAYQLHEGQYRKSGELYISHPVAVAGLLRDLGGSPAMIAAGFLHDVVEDTDVTSEQIEEHFGPEVRQLVEGVTKLSKINFTSKTESQAENFRRMFLAMAQDIRVIVVKYVRIQSPPQRARNQRYFCSLSKSFGNVADKMGTGRFVF